MHIAKKGVNNGQKHAKSVYTNLSEEYLSGVSAKPDDYSIKYRELYTQCYDEFAGYSSTSIQSSLLKGLSKTTIVVGKLVEKIPTKVRNSIAPQVGQG